MTDPYAPFPAARTPAFPRERLTRTGLDEDTVDRLADEYNSADAAGRTEFGRFVSANSDDVIRERFAEGSVDAERPAAGKATTYDELNALTVDELDDLLREWNDDHPEQHLTIAGRKGEKIGRLLDAYGEQPEETPPAAPVAAVADRQLPTAPTATATDGSPEGAPAAFTPPAGTVEIGAEGAQTTDAAGAGDTTTTTQE